MIPEPTNAAQELLRAPVYTLKMTLNGLTPSIWRRVFCPADAPLEWVSALFLETLGWEPSEHFEFKIADTIYSAQKPGVNRITATLAETGLTAGASFGYGCGKDYEWKFEIVVEEIRSARPMEPDFGCRAGERAAPFEDCGGTQAYAELLKAARDVEHSRYQEFEDRYQLTEFDSEYIDLAEVNERLQIELMMDDDAYDLLSEIMAEDQQDESLQGTVKSKKATKLQEDKVSLLLSVALTNQLMADDPKEVLTTTERLIESGLSEDEAFGEVLAVFSEEFFDAHAGEREFNVKSYVTNLNALA